MLVDDLAHVADSHPRGALMARDAHLHHRVRPCAADGVIDNVGYNLPEPAGVAVDDEITIRRMDLYAEMMPCQAGVEAEHHVADHCLELQWHVRHPIARQLGVRQPA